MHLRPECDRIFDGQAWVQRRITVLKHHLNLTAKLLEWQLTAADREAIEHHFPSACIDKLHQQARRSRFATAGFADHAERFALKHFKIYPVDRTDYAAPTPERIAFQRKMLLQSAHREQGLGGASAAFVHRHQPLLSIAARKPSESRLNEIEVTKIITPGSAATQGCT